MSEDRGERIHELQFRTAFETRNLEISLFWQRSNYFLVLNTAVAAGYFALDERSYAIPLAIFGLIVSCLWLLINLGGKYWQARWEERLASVEMSLDPRLKLFAVDSETIHSEVVASLSRGSQGWFRRLVNWAILKKPSVSRVMILLSVAFLGFWLFLVVVEADRSG